MDRKKPTGHIVSLALDVEPATGKSHLRLETVEHGIIATDNLEWPDLMQFAIGFMSASKAVAIAQGVSFSGFADSFVQAMGEAAARIEAIEED